MLALFSAALAFQAPPIETIQEHRFLLESMVMQDQEARNRMVLAINNKDNARIRFYSRELGRIDEENTAALKSIILAWGWPQIYAYGRQAAGHAWLIVQHADHDVRFQQKCLRLMEPLVPRGQVDGANFAYLYDRVARNTNRPQRFGTQLHTIEGRMVAQETEDPKNLDKRRAAVGLMPMKDYIKLAEEFYGRKD